MLEHEQAFDPDELLAHCRAQLEPYKIPALIDPVPEIRRNAVGKIVTGPS